MSLPKTNDTPGLRASGNPCLFVGGCPRSGTTLLQRMLDHHPELAMANDSHFIPRALETTSREWYAAATRGESLPLTEELCSAVWNYHRFYRLGLKRSIFDAVVGQAATYQQLVAGLFDAFADLRGKPLAGEKTPDYVVHFPLLAGLFPQARLIHMVRDGRNVALSLIQWATPTKGPGRLTRWSEDPIGVSALWWRQFVSAGHGVAAALAERYVTLRYEDLLADPEVQLRDLTRRIGLAFSAKMLRFHEGKLSSGDSAKSRWLPVTQGLRDWRTAMAEEDVAVFELLAGDTLQQFGYVLSGRHPSEAARNRAARIESWWHEPAKRRKVSQSPQAESTASKGLSVGRRVVIQGSPGVPGLECLLDVANLADRLPRTLDGSPPMRAAYVRLKPERNCLVGYQCGWGQWWGHAVAHRPDAEDKLKNAERYLKHGESSDGFVDHEEGLAVFRFPHDPRLPQLRRLFLPARDPLPELLSVLLPDWGSAVSLDVLSYKPQRRCVLRVTNAEGARAVLRCYLPGAYDAAHTANKHMSGQQWYAARRLGHSDRHHMLAHEWLDGQPLSLTDDPQASVKLAGEWLARLHAATSVKLPVISPEVLIDRMRTGCQSLLDIAPSWKTRVDAIQATITRRLEGAVSYVGLAHGDFHVRQMLLTSSGPVVVDWDHACVAPPGLDLACFVADHLVSLTLTMPRNPEDVLSYGRPMIDAFFASYDRAGGHLPANIWSHIAAQLLQVAAKPFRQQWVDWPAATASLLRLAEFCSDADACRATCRSSNAEDAVQLDLRGLATDGDATPKWLVEPLRSEYVEKKLANLRVSDQVIGALRLNSITVEKYVPERRCLLRYSWGMTKSGETVTLLGKLRRKRLDVLALDTQRRLHAAISPNRAWRVAEPVAVVPAWNMWIQSCLPGRSAVQCLTPDSDVDLAYRIGQVLAQLHGLELQVAREHTWKDEYSILADGLQRVAEESPWWSARIESVLAACGRQLATLPVGPRRGIHRDFYPAQVLVADGEIGLVDFDNFAMGHPSVDVGNFVAHLIEAGLRVYGDPDVLNGHAQSFVEGYLADTSTVSRDQIEAMTLVSLARHIFICHRIRARKAFCQSTLELCEERLSNGISHQHQRGARVCHE